MKKELKTLIKAILMALVGLGLILLLDKPAEFISPLAEAKEPPVSMFVVVPSVMPTATPTPVAGVDIDRMVESAVEEFGTGPDDKSHLKYQLHCLLYFESKHWNARTCGDNQLACGPLQYHQPTWVGFRKIMIKRGLASDVNDRFNLNEAIRTTAWAIKDGRINNWGPYLRGNCR